MRRIAITGSYGGCNLGDEAILTSLVAGLRAELPVEITVFSGHPDDTLGRHDVDRAVQPLTMSRESLTPELERLDLLVVGGGGILYDHWVRDHAREAMIAEEHGVPVMVCGVGVGPLDDTRTQEDVRKLVSSADVVTVRDTRSQQALERLDVRREILVTADPALLLQPQPLPEGTLEREGLARRGRLIGMSVREPGPAAPHLDVDAYHALLANAADYLVERFDADIVFVPMEPDVLDMQHSHAVVGKMFHPQRAWVLKGSYSAGQMLTLIRELDFAVGMRLHFLIMAALQGVPFVALPYASKVFGFIEEIGLENPPLRGLTVGRLLAYLDKAWDRQDIFLETIRANLPELQERARRNLGLAAGILRERSPLGTGG